jgi:hypothetical protein
MKFLGDFNIGFMALVFVLTTAITQTFASPHLQNTVAARVTSTFETAADTFVSKSLQSPQESFLLTKQQSPMLQPMHLVETQQIMSLPPHSQSTISHIVLSSLMAPRSTL